MAVIKAGALIADIRGKVGTNVFSRNQGGAIVRDLGTWAQPDTDAQTECRNTLEDLAVAWSSTLTEAQREAWRTYAVTNPRPNRWGVRSLTNGYVTFIRHNFHSYLDTSALQFPTAPTAGGIHPPGLVIKVQQNGCLSITGALTPDVTGLYHPSGQYDGHPVWKWEDGDRFIWRRVAVNLWYLTTVIGAGWVNFWTCATLPGALWDPGGGGVGNGAGAWTYDSSLARITTPPTNYPTPPAGLTLYLYSGKPLNEGRIYYSGPFVNLTRLAPAIAAVAATTWLRWTWPVHAIAPPWTWPADGSGTAQGYAVAQDAISGSISTKGRFYPMFGSLTPW